MYLSNTVPDGQMVRLVGSFPDPVMPAGRVTALNVAVSFNSPFVDLTFDSASEMICHPQLESSHVKNVVEFCAGMGATAIGLQHAGFTPKCAVEWKEKLADLHRSVHPTVPVVTGDVCDPMVLQHVRTHVHDPFTLVAGVSCQPYSSGGAQRGGDDPRSETVPGVIRACYLMQCPMLIMECVVPARTNNFFKAHVKALVTELGYHVNDITMKLEEVWAANRFRWWIVASHPALDLVHIPKLPSFAQMVVRDLMPYVKVWPKEVEDQLELSAVELDAFRLDGSQLKKYVVKLDQKLPTALHSWGNQATCCPCGCRESGFSPELVKSRGIYGQLLPLPAADGCQRFRHLHAAEVALLNGIPPQQAWTSDERLNLCAAGQIASPLQSVWIGASVMRHIQVISGEASLTDPVECLQSLKHVVLAQAKVMFPIVVPSVADVPSAHPEGNLGLRCSGPQQVSTNEVADTPPCTEENTTAIDSACVLVETDEVAGPLAVQVSPDATVADLCAAEAKLQKVPLGQITCLDVKAGSVLPGDTHVGGKRVWIDLMMPRCDSPAEPAESKEEESVDQEVLEDTEARPVAHPEGNLGLRCNERVASEVTVSLHRTSAARVSPVDSVAPPVSSACHLPVLPFAFSHLSAEQLVALIPPSVAHAPMAVSVRSHQVLSEDRLAVLANQGFVWGDDEVLFFLKQSIRLTNPAFVALVDPLLASSWVSSCSPQAVQDMLTATKQNDAKLIVTAFLRKGHWTPCMWHAQGDALHVYISDQDDSDLQVFHHIHAAVCTALGLKVFSLYCERHAVMPSCGAAACAFLEGKLLGHSPVMTAASVESFHFRCREVFTDAVADCSHVLRPWAWGAGVPNVPQLLQSLLQLHGVPVNVAASRSKLVMQSLGSEEVAKAVTGAEPWKSLKSLANLQTPRLQLVLPDELQAVVQQREATKNRPSKSKGKGKGKASNLNRVPAKQADIDPTKLVLPKGAFCDDHEQAVPQLTLQQVGPLAVGLAIASHSDVLPFLQSGQVLTNKCLALLVINHKDSLATTLDQTDVKFAVTCALNNEPMLLQGTLVQLGRTPIKQYCCKDVPMVPIHSVACARIAVFKDQWEGSWETFASQPVKSVLQLVPALQTCHIPECDCEKWHPTEDDPSDVLLDVFKRQFFTDSGKPVSWEKASHFAFNVRYMPVQEEAVLRCSGTNGVFVEPRTEDALQPSESYHVVWMPHLDFAQVQHRAQCEPHSIGLARRQDKFGVRVHSDHFQAVFCSMKPDSLFLPPGPKSMWSCGPWPFGADRKALAKIFKQWGWNARPTQPLHTVDGGMMWGAQAVDSPPQTMYQTPHGQVLIASHAKPVMPAKPTPNVVCQTETLKLCEVSSGSGAIDPLQAKDPWQAALHKAAASTAQPSVTTQLQELEGRLEKTILSKLPMERMEVDEVESRLHSLEAQMQQMAGRHQALETVVQEHHVHNSAQLQTLQSQLMSHLDGQSKSIEQMLQAQTTKLDAILNKKGRWE
eukprot:Skav221761  [mRNA]  locus=scaffold490:25889:30370:+ [translate_table: standard]